MGQIAVATAGRGMAMGWAMGWSIGAGVVFGLSLSVASTVVLLRALQERGLVTEERSGASRWAGWWSKIW
jgi:CPA2 family monovalent cation:H+ antiporter-2